MHYNFKNKIIRCETLTQYRKLLKILKRNSIDWEFKVSNILEKNWEENYWKVNNSDTIIDFSKNFITYCNISYYLRKKIGFISFQQFLKENPNV